MPLVFLLSCATEFHGERIIAEEQTCTASVKKFFKKDRVEDVTTDELNAAFKDKKLISFSNKYITINHPRFEWYVDVRKKLLTYVKNWNKNNYPTFYLDNKENFLTEAKEFYSLIGKEAENSLSDSEKVTLENIKSWISSYQNYSTELEQLLDQRISLQYNLDTLKKIKLSKKEVRDIKITTKVGEDFKTEIITLREVDSNLGLVLNRLKDKIKDLDGKLNNFGLIEERVIKQALLQDALTILQRELEYNVKNAATASPEAVEQLKALEEILQNNSFEPSTYGIFKITNSAFKSELAELFSVKKLYKNIQSVNERKVRDTIATIVENSTTKNSGENRLLEKEKFKKGTLRKIYNKVATFTPYQKFMTTTKLAAVGYGAYRFFWFQKDAQTGSDTKEPIEEVTEELKTEVLDKAIEVKNEILKKSDKKTTKPTPTPTPISEPVPEDKVVEVPTEKPEEVKAHNEQLAETQKVVDSKSEGQSKVVEISEEELNKSN
jgi:hypothetical protein